MVIFHQGSSAQHMLRGVRMAPRPAWLLAPARQVEHRVAGPGPRDAVEEVEAVHLRADDVQVDQLGLR